MVRTWRVVLLALAFGLAGNGGVNSQNADELFAFRRAVVVKGGHGVTFEDPVIQCVAPIKLLGINTGMDVYFISEHDGPAEVWAAADFPITNLNELWTGGSGEHQQTSEWGWMYDRNGDGQIDWLAYIADTATVLPEEGFQEGFPNLVPTKEQTESEGIPLTKSQFEIYKTYTRGTYRNFIDRDFDGTLDQVITAPIAEENGWREGAMLVSFKGMSVTGCVWRSDYDATDTQNCRRSGESLVTEGNGPARQSDLPHIPWALLAKPVIDAAVRCDFGDRGIAQRP